ncbi:hypothetical protein THAOC_02684 [Thalassiosira oceanica]|uniref:Uncharacterized protein n=1 Tax=Thalassiosira oceanica TaxID=159749 RepID=K0TLT3_THAOC|nr:hypothetical protein THAOC_02684 [Thalassiosira oceanica]|eukprot:EJK75591.1 hypothetical protein THAOC_02684 [Thalassiosira oceanica]
MMMLSTGLVAVLAAVAAVGSVESFTLDLNPSGDSKGGAFDNVGSISAGSSTISSVGVKAVEETFRAMKDKFNDELFLYETPLMEWVPSSVYRFDDFMDGLNVMHSQGIAGKKVCRESLMGDDSSMLLFLSTTRLIFAPQLYMGGDCGHCHMYGLINVAAFLAQAMKETMYPIANACGQLGQSYQDYHCPPGEEHMECPIDPEMTITAVTNARWWGAPGPLKCGPKSLYPQTGYWDFNGVCDDVWADPPKYCTDYEGQKGGKAMNDAPYANAAGRTDVEGWWGRGVIQTTGESALSPENEYNTKPLTYPNRNMQLRQARESSIRLMAIEAHILSQNYFLGKRAADEGRESRYPSIDFCRCRRQDPEAICSSEEYKELKWIGKWMPSHLWPESSGDPNMSQTNREAGLFYWTESVQSYDAGGWNYLTELHKFVDEGLSGDAFINAVSGIPCGTGALDGGPERAENFYKIVDAMEFSFVEVKATPKPTPDPTPFPTRVPTFQPTPSPTGNPSSRPTQRRQTESPTVKPSPVPPSVTTAPAIRPAADPPLVRYTCGSFEFGPNDQTIPPTSGVTFDYDLHNLVDVSVGLSLKDIKRSIMSDVAGRLGCQENSIGQRRVLQSSEFDSIIGLESPANDLPDNEVVCRIDETKSDEPTVCSPVNGGFTLYAKPGTSNAILSSIGNSLKEVVADGMNSGRYESTFVDKAVYIGDRQNDQVILGEEEIMSTMELAVYALSAACGLLLCVLCVILFTRVSRDREKRAKLEDREFQSYMMEDGEAERLDPMGTGFQQPGAYASRRSMMNGNIAPFQRRISREASSRMGDMYEGEEDFYSNPTGQPPMRGGAELPSSAKSAAGYSNDQFDAATEWSDSSAEEMAPQQQMMDPRHMVMNQPRQQMPQQMPQRQFQEPKPRKGPE